LINQRVRTAIGELYDYVFGDPQDSATIRRRRVPPDSSRRVQRRLPPEEIEELVSGYVAGGTAIALAGTHSIHRTTVLALLERHQVSRRGRVLTPDHIKRAVSLFTPRDALVPRSAESSRSIPRRSGRPCWRLAWPCASPGVHDHRRSL